MIILDNIRKISIIGAGSWGSSIAIVLAENSPEIQINMWAYEKSVESSINDKNENIDFLPGIKLPLNIVCTTNIKESVIDAEVVVFATPSKVIFNIAQKCYNYIKDDAVISFLTKGFCKINNEVLTISKTIEKALPHFKDKTIAVYGPSHAEEVTKKYHTCLNVAGDKQGREILSSLLNNSYMQCREIDDILGVEIGGTLKNPAAIAAGMISVLPQCGDNLSGALISEALKEMISLGRVFGADIDTIIDITGLGDLVATALSEHSRNRRFGKEISQQIISKKGGVGFVNKFILKFNPNYVIGKMSENLHYLAEGAYAIEPLIKLADENGISIPVYRSLYEVLLNKKDPSLLIETIKNPDKFDEIYSKTKIQVTDRQRGFEKISGTSFKKNIIDKTLKKFISDDKKKDGERDAVIENLKTFSEKNVRFSKDKKDIEIIRKISKKNYKKSISNLVKKYVPGIVDKYNSKFRFIYLNFLRIFKFFKAKNFKYRLTGSFNEIKDLNNNLNIIYVSTYKCFYDFVFIVLSIYKKSLPFPRFFVSSEAVRSKWDNIVIRLTGGFIIDNQLLSNIVYRESLSQYILTMIDNGVPLLYFPENIPSVKPLELKIKYDFFSLIIESLYANSIEICPATIKTVPQRQL